MCRCHRLKPHCLPDTADRSVPDAPVDEALLSARLKAVVGSILNLHLQDLLSGLLQIRGDVE